jgi:hypothetical protein
MNNEIMDENSVTSVTFCKYMYVFAGARVLWQFCAWQCTGRAGFDPWQGQSIFLLATAPRLALGPTQPPMVSGSFPQG